MLRCIPRITFTCTIAFAAVGCMNDADDTADAARTPDTPSPWQSGVDGWRIALSADMDGADISTAIAEAHATVAEARQRWLATPEAQRSNWAVKWAAPLENGDNIASERAVVEHVWVTPLHWSPFRIEGVLLSQPVGTLHNGRAQGDLVSFPIEELSDWVHFVDGDSTGDREGGYTIDSLEARYGKPPATP